MMTNAETLRMAAQGLRRSFARQLFWLLFPPVCYGCDRHVAEPCSLCGACWSRVRFVERPYCPVLGTPFSHDLGAEIVSAEAIAAPPPFRRARSVAAHEGVIARMVYGLKYNDRTDLGPWMARWMWRAGAELLEDCDVIVPVPLHARRFWTRRFNQSAELSRHLGHLSGKPFAPDALRRVKWTTPQVGLGHDARRRNVSGVFKVPDAQEIKVRGRRILLVDDVYTTGATAKAATRALLRGGASSVDVLTFSRVLGEELPV